MEENLSVKKGNLPTQDNLGQSWNAFLDICQQTGNFYFKLLNTSLQTAHRFNSELLKDMGNLNNSTSENVQTILEQNNRMYQNASDNLKRSFEGSGPNEADTERLAQSIDYALLSKLVAEELRKSAAQ